MGFKFGAQPHLVVPIYSYKNVTVSGTFTGISACILHKIWINAGSTGQITISDGLTSSGGRHVASFIPYVSGVQYEYNVKLDQGLSIFSSAAPNYTVAYLA